MASIEGKTINTRYGYDYKIQSETINKENTKDANFLQNSEGKVNKE